jgi:hypothetical protein
MSTPEPFDDDLGESCCAVLVCSFVVIFFCFFFLVSQFCSPYVSFTLAKSYEDHLRTFESALDAGLNNRSPKRVIATFFFFYFLFLPLLN